jgi:gliding motility-associated-like protein
VLTLNFRILQILTVIKTYMKKVLLLTLASVSCLLSFSQDFSNKGKDFYLCFPSHVQSSSPAQMEIFITSDKNSSGVITYNGQTHNFTVTANTVTTVPIVRAAAYISDAESNTPVAKGIRVKVNAGQPAVVVYTEIYAAARTEASLILPVNVLGRKYQAISYFQRSTANSKSQFQIISVEPNTTVQIQLRQNGIVNPNLITVTLPNAGDVYQYQDAADISGSIIESVATTSAPCKKIAVFSGSSALAINNGSTCSGNSYDPLFQQCYPVSSWGKKFGVVPIAGNPYGFQCRVMASEDNTTVVYNATTVTLNKGQVYPPIAQNVVAQTQPFFITADKPISAAQYLLSENCAGPVGDRVGDPDMIILNPVEQNISNITIFTSTKQAITQQRMNVLIPTAGVNSFKINGVTVGGFQQMPTDPNFAYLQYLFPTGNNSYTLSADSGFNAICYGLGSVESYGYSAGTNVKDLYQFIGIVNPYVATSEPATCSGTPFNFSITLPYQPLSLHWDFNGHQTPNVTQTAPVHDTTYVVQGKQVWRYKLPNSYTYPVGTFPVTVTSNNPTSEGCAGEQVIDFELNVYNPPVANFVVQNSGCVTDSVRFRDSSNTGGRPIVRWYWDFGDGTFSNQPAPAKLYAAAGTYNVRYAVLTNVGCLSDTITKQVVVTSAPVAKFGLAAPYCVGRPLTFTDSSSAAAPSTIARWFWNWGDGLTDTFTTGGNRTHVYTTTGTFTATLKVETASGCQSTVFSRTFNVTATPIVDFTLPTVCLSTPAQFTDLSTIADGTQGQFTYLWTFGEPSSGSADTSILKNPTHTYSSTGPFTVTLRVTSVNGCRTDSSKILTTVYPQPTSGFNVNASTCFNDSTAFTSTSSVSSGTITNYYWEFGDGNFSSLQNPKHKYLAPGTYTVKHYIKTDRDCVSDTSRKTIVVHPLPTSNFAVSSPTCANKTITFTDNSIAGAGNISSWFWDMGDGNVVTRTSAAPFTHTYASSNTYTVTLYVETNNGCRSAITSKQVVASPKPRPGFIMPEICLTDAFAQFTDTSSIEDGTQGQFTYLWNFGDPASGPNNTSTQKNPQHTFSSVGNYTITLRVTSNNGCDSTISKQFTVNGAIPNADFTVQNSNNLCVNDSVRINNTSTVDFGTVTKIEVYWDFANNPTQFVSDDFPAPNKQYSHLYPLFNTPASKTYRIRMRTFSGGTCVDDVIKDVVVYAKPNVIFDPIPNSCSNASFQITQARVEGPIPGNGVFSGPGVTPTGFFDANTAGTGVHTIRYTFTTTPAGCSDFKEQTITVVGVATSSFTSSSPKCATQAITFADASSSPSGSITSWRWNFGDGSPDTVLNSNTAVTHAFATAGTYQVKLTITTSVGCSKDTIIPINVTPMPVPDFSFNEACLPNATVQFSDLSTIADGTESQFTYSWNFGDPGSGADNSATTRNPTHVYTSAGSYIVTLTVTSGGGCSRTISKVYDKIHPRPTARFTATPTEVCVGGTISFTDASTGGDTTLRDWYWDFGNGVKFTGQNPPPVTYNSARTYVVSLHVVNNRLCTSDTFKVPVTVHPYPNVDIGADRHVLEGGSIVLNPNVTGEDLTYLWSPNRHISDPTVKNPTVTGVADITYTLTVTSRGGCSDSDQVNVKVLKFPTIPNTFTPNNDGINDVWEITALDTYPNARIQVFSRLGQLVFESKGYSTPWNGTYKGTPLPYGTYYYIIEPGSGRKPITGYVTIIK